MNVLTVIIHIDIVIYNLHISRCNGSGGATRQHWCDWWEWLSRTDRAYWRDRSTGQYRSALAFYYATVILSVCPSVLVSRHSTVPSPGEIEISSFHHMIDSLASLVFRDKISCPRSRGFPRTRGERGTLFPKRRYYAITGWFNVKMVADRHKHVAYYNKHWRRAS